MYTTAAAKRRGRRNTESEKERGKDGERMEGDMQLYRERMYMYKT